MIQTGFFDLENRHRKLDEKDPLIHLNQLIDWESFRSSLIPIRAKKKKSNAGRKPYDLVLMFKVLILQHLYNISDDETEYMIRDRYSFCRFLKLLPEDPIPDAKTIWLFREALVQHQLDETLFDRFNQQLDQQGYQAKKGQIVDASFVDVPKQRNNREENAQIKAGEIPERFQENAHVKAQKDTDARWTKKNQETHFGYKNHVSVDNQHKLIRNYQVTSAEVHDSNVFVDLLVDNSSKSVWADSAYRSEAIEDSLEAAGHRSHVHKKGKRNKSLTEAEKQSNTKKSSVRARVEHVFGSITNEQGGLNFRVIGVARTATKIGLMNLAYNMRRYVTLHRMSLSRV